MNLYQNRFAEKLREALTAVSPTIGIVLLLSFTIAPIPPSILLLFLFGAVMLIVGMMFFTLGAELAMTPVGERIGTRIAQSRKLGIVLLLCFVLGFVITISEPDLQVLAEQVPSVPNATDRCSGSRCGSLSDDCNAPYVVFENITDASDYILSPDICISFFCAG